MLTPSLADFIIDTKDYVIKHQIGQGQSSSVFVAEENSTKKQVVFKYYDRSPNSNNEILQRTFFREIETLLYLRHEGIVPFVGFSLGTPTASPFIAMEYMEEGTLYDVLRKLENHEFVRGWDQTTQLIIAFGIASAIKFMHSKGILHRDIKPANILLDKELYPKLCDFGLSKTWDLNLTRTSGVGTPIYMAPELHNAGDDKESEMSFACDIYSFGLLLFEILTERPLCSNKQQQITALLALLKGNRPNFPDSITPFSRKLISACWAHDPTKRPTAEDLLKMMIEHAGELVYNADVTVAFNYLSRLGIEIPFNQTSAYSARPTAPVLHMRENSNPSIEKPPKITLPIPNALKKSAVMKITKFGMIPHITARTPSTAPGSPILQPRRICSPLVPGDSKLPALRQTNSPPAQGVSPASIGGIFASIPPSSFSVEASSVARGRPEDVLLSRGTFASDSGPSQFLRVRFHGCVVSVSAYTLRSSAAPAGGPHIRTWVLECDGPDGKWATLDSRGGDFLNGPCATKTFTVHLRRFAHEVRLRVVGDNWRGTDELVLAGLELFGEIRDI